MRDGGKGGKGTYGQVHSDILEGLALGERDEIGVGEETLWIRNREGGEC